MRRRLFALATGSLILLGVPGTAPAQDTAWMAAAEAGLARATAKQSRIRIRLASGEDVQLVEPTVTDGRLSGTPRAGKEPVGYSVALVDQVWRRGSAATTGMAIGAIVGAVAGAAGGVALSSMCIMSCSAPSSSEQITAGAGGGVMGALAGGFLGALIAAPIQKWKTVYRAAPTVTPIVSTAGVGVAVRF